VATLAALLLLSAVGCARNGQLLALNPRKSSIREQLSRLEFQNQQLKDELKVAQDESQTLASNLRLAEIDRQDLERRVESYRTQLGMGTSGDPYELARPNPGGSGAGPEFQSTRPASRPPSAAPFTRIPNRSSIDVTPPPGPSVEESFGFGAGSGRSPSYESRPRPSIDPPPVQYFDLSPSASRSDVGAGGLGIGSSWSPLARSGSSRGLD
jgi:hypothetical protein